VGNIDISQDAVEKLASLFGRKSYVSPPRDPASYSTMITCADAESTDRTLLALRATIDAAEARAVGAKPLVWDAPDQWENSGSIYPDGTRCDYRAVTGIGTYFVFFDPITEQYRAAYDRKEVGEWGSLVSAKAAAQADYTARILSALHPASPLGAVAMKAAAVKSAKDRADYWRETAETAKANKNPKEARDWQSMMLAGLFVKDAIEALPLPTPAELLAVAAELPEVQALVSAATSAKLILAEYEPHPLPMLGGLLAALAPFARKGE